ncbi:Armadillo-type [Corchorus olitorius]|uniref:Armadillo-type n=1 Tax=Corchorus olitorius TaxID=93759 RepID=A0A1R3GHB0_9ROSI|nr:Armadillo-type [Corchorus olitorius]
MAIADSRDQALSLLAAANNHSDLVVKLSSLKQARDILSSLDSSYAADLFPYLADLQRSPETLVRKFLVEIIEDIALRSIEHSSILVPVLVAFLRDSDSNVVKQSIICGTNFFCGVLEEMALQFQQHGKVDRWIEELWLWMVRFKEGVFSIALEPGPVGTKLLALKFLETYVLLFTPDNVDSEKLEVALTSDANRTLVVLLDMLQSAGSLPGSVTITVVNCLAAIARKRPFHYGTVLSVLLDFNPNFETVRGCHNASIQYSLRTAFLGFLRSTYPTIVELKGQEAIENVVSTSTGLLNVKLNLRSVKPSRDRLIRALRAMNAGDAADQVIRQVEKMIKNSERASRENRSGRDEQFSNQASVAGDVSKKRYMPQDNEELTNSHEMVSKRTRYGHNSHSVSTIQMNDPGQDLTSVNGLSSNSHLSDSNWTPVEQMIAMIGALLAEGERGAESLEILISKIHPDLLADIVITNMKHLPKSPPPLTRLGTSQVPQQAGFVNSPAQVVPPPTPINSLHPPVPTSQLGFTPAVTTSSSDTSTVNNFAADSKRDPRRDPRRLDPRRAAASVGVPSTPVLEDTGAAHPEFDGSISNKPLSVPVVESPPVHSMSNVQNNDKIIEGPSVSSVEQPTPEGDALGSVEDIVPILEAKNSSHALSPPCTVDEDSAEIKVDADAKYENDASSFPESDQEFSASINVSSLDEAGPDLPVLPPYVELTEDQKRSVRKSAVQQIAESYLHLHWSDCSETRMTLLARLVAQIDADDDIVAMLGKQIVSDYQQQKGHEIVLQILYHLYSLMVPNSVDNSSCSAVLYEKFLLTVAESLLDTFPASDRSFSRLLGEAPFLPDSALKLLNDLCYLDVCDVTGKEIRDAERVTQGLGVVWSLIMGRPNNRQACLGIALKCAVHPQDEIRGKAIRLVANKLYQLSYTSGEIEQFATNMLMSAVDQRAELLQPGSTDERGEGEVGSGDMSSSGSKLLEPRASGIDLMITEATSNSASIVSVAEAQRLISLYFALCTKKPSLLQVSFDIYGQAPKVVKQAFHRHIPIVIRALGQSYSQLLRIISDPPQGSENLLTLVLQILTQDTTPSPDLIAAVKHLYETKLKDATILIPMLSSLSKKEVLPIFPRLVDLPLEKFQLALAHILQGSAHTGPALTPAEVLVAIHDIIPEKDGLPLKKIMDACSACFEQRTVFTQQVLAKALNQMVDQIPLPLLFMRTVIQAIDAFPTLVDFVMEILSKLVSKQIWRMPKLWVGFLKCVAQTQPHSFPVLLQLPPAQLESALNKYGGLRSPLAAYASQPTRKGSLPRSTLTILGLANESHMQQPHMSNLHPSDNSSVQGTTLT